MKRNRKIVSILLTLSLLVTLLLPLATPAAAAGLTDNYVEREVNVSDSADTGTFGSLWINEDGDFPTAFSEDAGDPSQITITLLDGVEFQYANDTAARALVAFNSPTLGFNVVSSSDTSVTLEVYAPQTGSPLASNTEKMRLDFTNLKIDSSFSGDVKVEVKALDSSITSGEYTIGRVVGAECTATAVNKRDVSIGDTGEKLGTIRIEENAANALDDGTLIITLPDDYDWDRTTTVELGGSLKNWVKTSGGSIVRSYDDEELTLTILDRPDSTTRGTLDITPYVDVPYNTDPGDIEVSIEGDGEIDLADTDLILGKAEDFGTTLSVDEVKEIFAGQFDKELGEITVECDADDSINDSRYIILDLSSNAKFIYSYAEDKADVSGYAETEAGKDVDDKTTVTDVSDNQIVLKTDKDMSNTDELKLDKLQIATSLGSSGDVTIKFSGNAGVEGELVVAKINAPVTATVENATEVKIGVQGQEVGEVLVKETAKEAFAEEAKDEEQKDITPTLSLKAPDGVTFSGRPTAEVTEGDVELKSDNLVKLDDADDDGLYDTVYVEIDNESSTPSTVKFSGIKVNVNRSFPEGPITFKVGGSSLSDLGSQDMFNSSNAAYVNVASVVTPAPQEGAGSGMFVIGQGFYNLNGQMKMMDVAPYIKGDRTYVPVRYLAYVCGLTDDDIAWDEATQTVTLTKGETVVTLVIGSKTLTVGDQTTEMDVAPEINNGRTMLPARYVAEAFGGVVTWNEATQAVGIDF